MEYAAAIIAMMDPNVKNDMVRVIDAATAAATASGEKVPAMSELIRIGIEQGNDTMQKTKFRLLWQVMGNYLKSVPNNFNNFAVYNDGSATPAVQMCHYAALPGSDGKGDQISHLAETGYEKLKELCTDALSNTCEGTFPDNIRKSLKKLSEPRYTLFESAQQAQTNFLTKSFTYSNNTLLLSRFELTEQTQTQFINIGLSKVL